MTIRYREHAHAGAPRAGDGVGVVGLLTQPLADARCARGEMGEVGNEPVAEMLRATF